ncbi:MAG: von Willebrand factor type A domain-containing protein [Candidatus Brocadiales bacterium]|nr:von Willebrand factor type A domain-containing protein [Candidatus Bathyanammoxibius amoris]
MFVLVSLFVINFNSFTSAAEWQKLPGSAHNIGVGANGVVWIIGADPTDGGYGIYRWNDIGWDSAGGGGIRIAVTPGGKSWVVNSRQEIFRRVGGSWRKLPGSAHDIGVGANGAVWIIGTDETDGGYGIYRWNGSGWDGVDGGGVRIAVGPAGEPWIVNSRQEIFERAGDGWQKLPGSAHDIGVGANGAVWIIGTDTTDGGYGIHGWNGVDWDKVEGSAVAIAVGPDGELWIVNAEQEIFRGEFELRQKDLGFAGVSAVSGMPGVSGMSEMSYDVGVGGGGVGARGGFSGMAMLSPPLPAASPDVYLPLDREQYAHIEEHGVKSVAEAPVSTFSIDVDTGSYSNVRRFLNEGRLPRRDAVRVEELINYFAYDYPVPEDESTPFRVTMETCTTPWNPDTYLLHIGLKGYDVDAGALPPANLVFLIDVSGSMSWLNKLDLVKSSLKLLTRKLREQDRISIVVYAGASGVVLDSVSGKDKVKILQALDALEAGGRTHGSEGIERAYQLAEQNFIEGGINRVLLATDGDFNVGTIDVVALEDLIKQKRKTGISLTTLGFGVGNYDEELMERLADVGNGNYAYIDTLKEGRKVLVEQMASTLHTIAKDVKIQVEFNPSEVAEYRLIGYENRVLKREDFSNDKVDAGEIGAGHTVTVLYEIALVGGKGLRLEPLRYQPEQEAKTQHSDELAFLRLRYKPPQGDESLLIERPLKRQDITDDIAASTDNFRFAAAVTAYGQLLRGGRYTRDFEYDDVLQLARGARADDPFGYRGEFIQLVLLTEDLDSADLRGKTLEVVKARYE